MSTSATSRAVATHIEVDEQHIWSTAAPLASKDRASDFMDGFVFTLGNQGKVARSVDVRALRTTMVRVE